ncbi:MAG TPA: sigma-70 family RNA polymerase sigma factor [Terriglobales bacterium]|nr:sigma-70 family RNA polymerase sigma factor [Terriglobales bacterium]
MEDTLAGAAVTVGREAAATLTREAFEQIVAAHQQRIYRLLITLLRDADAAQTLTQECFLRAYRKRAGFRGEAGVGTWLTHIAVNLARDHGRSRARRFWEQILGREGREDAESQAERLPDRAPSPERSLLARESTATVWALAAELPGRQREVFLLRFAEEMSLEEIAQALDLEVGTVKAHLFRAVTVMRRRLEELGWKNI